MITSPFIPVKQEEFDGTGKGIEEGLVNTRACFGLCDRRSVRRVAECVQCAQIDRILRSYDDFIGFVQHPADRYWRYCSPQSLA